MLIEVRNQASSPLFFRYANVSVMNSNTMPDYSFSRYLYYVFFSTPPNCNRLLLIISNFKFEFPVKYSNHPSNLLLLLLHFLLYATSAGAEVIFISNECKWCYVSISSQKNGLN